jgi:hypothetical protein
MVVAQPRLSPHSGASFWFSGGHDAVNLNKSTSFLKTILPRQASTFAESFMRIAETPQDHLQLDWCCFGCIGGFKVIGHDLWQNLF